MHMKKALKRREEKEFYEIQFPWGEKFTIGPGISNVPTSPDSLAETDMKRMIKTARAASKAGVYDTENDAYGSASKSATE